MATIKDIRKAIKYDFISISGLFINFNYFYNSN